MQLSEEPNGRPEGSNQKEGIRAAHKRARRKARNFRERNVREANARVGKNEKRKARKTKDTIKSLGSPWGVTEERPGKSGAWKKYRRAQARTKTI